MENIINCKGLKCPEPVIITKKYFDSINEGSATIVVDNHVAKNNILKFSQNNGFESKLSIKDGLFYIEVKKNKCIMCEPVIFNKENLCIVVASSHLGDGDDKLGSILMKSYLYALSESDILPTDLLFLNSGVKLSTEGSDCIESLMKLSERGVNILNCGTCLDFYELKEKLLVGEITNMYTIVEKMNASSKTIKL